MQLLDYALAAAGGLAVLFSVSDSRRYRAEQLAVAVWTSFRGYLRIARMALGGAR